LLDLMAQQHHIGYPVVNEKGEAVGMITLEEAAQVSKEKRETTLLIQIIRKNPVVVNLGQTALDAFKKMSDNETGRVLVVDPAKPRQILGMITKTDLMHTMIEQCK